jgi:hypothetical protein
VCHDVALVKECNKILLLLRTGRHNFDGAVQIPLNRKWEAECGVEAERGLTRDSVGDCMTILWMNARSKMQIWMFDSSLRRGGTTMSGMKF